LAELRREYKEKYQPIAEHGEHAARLRPLVEEFWLHMTNSANSDGRWPPPPSITCEFNREWVLAEMAATRRTLDKLAKATKGMALPAPPEIVVPPPKDWRYGYHFTDKEINGVTHLNNYELQHAIYYAHKMVDSDQADKRSEGLALLGRVFDELDRRGMRGKRPKSLEQAR